MTLMTRRERGARLGLVVLGIGVLTTALLAPILLAACAAPSAVVSAPPSSPAASRPVTSPPPAARTPSPAPLVAWRGPVEHLFFHTLVIRPELAFRDPRQGKGFRDYFVTVGEFRAILDQLYANGWTLVDIHRAVAGTVRVPAGRRPLVISEDDVNYYRYEAGLGLGTRLVRDGDRVRVEVTDGHGGVRVTDEDLVPLVDDFVDQHPDFSADGARGVLAPTGYEGLFGERVDAGTAKQRAERRQRVRDVAATLIAHGWVIASHGFGHIDYRTSSLAADRLDVQRWKAQAEPLLGPTDVFVYPFGAEPPPGSAKLSMLRAEGFRILCDIDVVPRMVRTDGVVVMSRRHVDGIALAQQRRALAPLFDTATVVDAAARR